MLPSFVLNGWWIFSLRPQKCLGTAVWAPEGWAIIWELILTEKYPLTSDCVPNLFTFDSLLTVSLTVSSLHLIQGSHSLEEKWFEWCVFGIFSNFHYNESICYHCRKKWGCRRRVSWWLCTLSRADKGLKLLQLQNSLSFNKMDSGQPWREEPLLFDSPST